MKVKFLLTLMYTVLNLHQLEQIKFKERVCMFKELIVRCLLLYQAKLFFKELHEGEPGC